MKILFLGYKSCKLLDFLRCNYDTKHAENEVDISSLLEYDRIISFGYRHIIKPPALNSLRENGRPPIVNLHISYLPYNRGAHPNFWSWVDDTPKGVTIHHIDEGIDTGPILLQKIVGLDINESLKQGYEKLIEEIQNLFIKNHTQIINNKMLEKHQDSSHGSLYFLRDLKKQKDLLINGWETTPKQLQELT